MSKAAAASPPLSVATKLATKTSLLLNTCNKKPSSLKSSRKSRMETHDKMEVKHSPPELGVTKGQVAVYAGMPEKRFMVPTRCLTRPDRVLVLLQSGKRGILCICCKRDVFEKALQHIEEAFCLKFSGGGSSYYHTLSIDYSTKLI